MIRIVAFLLALVVAAEPMAASAQGRVRGGGGGGYEQGGGGGYGRGQVISMEQAVAIVARRTPGRLLDASPMGANYRIVWITPDGRRIDFVVDAATGQILRADG